MFCLCRRDEHRIRSYLAEQAERSFSYGPVGCTEDGAMRERMPDWSVDYHRVFLGTGAEDFRRAKAAIAAWRMFPPEITSVFGCEIPRQGLNVAVLFNARPFPL